MIEVVLDDGSTAEYEIVTIFYLSKTNKKYIVYTDGKQVDGILLVGAVCYAGTENTNYETVVDNNEWSLIIKKMSEIGFEVAYDGKE